MQTVHFFVNFWTVLHLIWVLDCKNIDEDEMWMVGVNSYGSNRSSQSYPGYGSEWVYFPDGNGVPHFANLTLTDHDSLRVGKHVHIENRLYTRGSSDHININESAQSHVLPDIARLLSNKPVKLVTHGWLSSDGDNMMTGIIDAYSKHRDVVVISIDWSGTASNINYPFVAMRVAEVGTRVAKFLDMFCALYQITGDRLHLIGHSLGAHVMGIAASKTKLTVGRVTGLDPARPLFEYPKTLKMGLTPSAAEFVDVIHTCGGTLGIDENGGHVDFYPNGGKSPQPGCDSKFFIFVPEPCSHSRAHKYFSESIANPRGFPSCQSKGWAEYLSSTACKETTVMGEDVDRNSRGQYYLSTNAKAPFATNKPKALVVK
ncbi:pancreatic triacylglycerol lipase-like [Leguminivora glycinivorella]|uniref:pancreatic triacylglycerol lipase-like n=1 Tax=Leguminivora glycinivorella TaxID=1035111 RepID=UPI00200BD781|nr:pancreatic triacylglycerol lipase-like [Leguminivora glycinivorella]